MGKGNFQASPAGLGHETFGIFPTGRDNWNRFLPSTFDPSTTLNKPNIYIYDNETWELTSA